MKRRVLFLLALTGAGILSAQEFSISVPDTDSAGTTAAPSPPKRSAGRRPFHMKLQLQGMDSLLKGLDTLMHHLPIPDEVEIDDRDLRIRMPEMPRHRGFEEPRTTERDAIIKFGSDVIIGRNELVHGDVVVFGGNVTVYGRVEGGVVTVKGDVIMASTSRIDGDVVCIWGNTDVNEGVTAGKTTVLDFGKFFQRPSTEKPSPVRILFFDLFRILLLLLTAVLIVSAFPKQTGAVTARVHSQYARSLLTGAAAILLIPAVFLILLVTIIGIPVALLVLPLLIIAGFLMGGAAVAALVGGRIGEQTNRKWTSPVLTVGLGILLLECIPFFGKLAVLAGPLFGKLAFLLGALVFLGAYVPGFGAVVSTRFGTRSKVRMEEGEKKRGKNKD